MEEINNTEAERTINDFWPSIALVGSIFGVVIFALGLIFGYMQIQAEPSGAMFSPMMFSGVIVCLVVAFAGAMAIWHYTREVTPFVKLGQGALIGFLTGTVIVIISTVLNEVWHLIDPEFTQKMIDSSIASMEAMDVPAETKDTMIDATVESMRSQQSIFSQILYGIPMYGILNLITGLIGVKIFGKKEDEETF
ncbi:MAG: DUF4199 domain-containing protein [Balneolaceae bacterium]